MLTNKQFGNLKYINIFDGHFAVSAQANADGATRRINKNGVEVWEYLYNNLSGIITGIASYENEYGKQWRIEIEDGPEKYVLALPDTSRYTKGFTYRIGNVNLARPIDLSIGKFIQNGKEIGFLTIHQEGKKIEPMWTKDNPGDLPQMKKVIVRNKEVWDDSEQLVYIEQFMRNVVIPRLSTDITDDPIMDEPFSDEAGVKSSDGLPF